MSAKAIRLRGGTGGGAEHVIAHAGMRLTLLRVSKHTRPGTRSCPSMARAMAVLSYGFCDIKEGFAMTAMHRDMYHATVFPPRFLLECNNSHLFPVSPFSWTSAKSAELPKINEAEDCLKPNGYDMAKAYASVGINRQDGGNFINSRCLFHGTLHVPSGALGRVPRNRPGTPAKHGASSRSWKPLSSSEAEGISVCRCLIRPPRSPPCL